MIEVKAVFTKQTVLDMGKSKRIGTYILFLLLAAAMLAGGIATLIIRETGFDIAMGIVLIVLSPIVGVLTFFKVRSDDKNNIKSFGVDKGDVVMTYIFAPEGISVSRTAEGKTVKESVYYHELYKVKRTKDAFWMYMNKEEMFFVPTNGFTRGTPDELFQLLYDSKVILDY